jgi:hypothetical protein
MARGGVVIRGATERNYELTAPGAAGQVLTSNGAGADPSFQAAGGVSDGDKGDITVSASGVTWTVDNDAVTNAKLANMTQSTIKGRAAGAGTGDPTDLTATQTTAILDNMVGDSGSGGTKGLVPAPSAGDAAANKFLKADGTWNAPSGSGDVTGPASSTDNAITRFDGTTGKTLQNSAITLDDNGVLAFPDDQRQTLKPGSNNAGVNVGSLAGDPSSPSNGDLWYDSTANELTARINGSNVALGAGGAGNSSIVVADSDESVSNDTLQDDDELFLSVEANTVYVLDALLLFTTGTSTTPDAKMGWTHPSGSTLTWSRHSYITAATLTTEVSIAQRYQEASAASTMTSGVISTATAVASPVWIRGVLRVGGTAGTLTLQWAQSTSTGGTPTVRKADSFVSLTQVS